MATSDDDPLFPGFLDDPAIYLAATDFWRATCDQVLAESGATDWDFRGAYRFLDGTLEQSGNPMFELWHEPMAKVVRVIQYEADPDHPLRISAYMDKRNWDDSGREVVICCVLTPRSVAIASALMTRWIQPEMTAEAMTVWLASPESPTKSG